LRQALLSANSPGFRLSNTHDVRILSALLNPLQSFDFNGIYDREFLRKRMFMVYAGQQQRYNNNAGKTPKTTSSSAPPNG